MESKYTSIVFLSIFDTQVVGIVCGKLRFTSYSISRHVCGL